VKRRIALLIADLQGGGAQRVAAQLSTAWAERGDDVTILTYEPKGSVPFFSVSPNVQVLPLAQASTSVGTASALMANLRRIRAVRAALEAIHPDVLFGFGPDSSFTGIIAAIGLSIPVIACERSDPYRYPTGIWKFLRDVSYRFCHSIICQTDRAADYFHARKNVRVIPNAVTMPDTTSPSDMPCPARPFIVTLGRLSTEKGHDTLIDAFALIAPRHPDLDLLIIGEGGMRDALEKQIKHKGLWGRVHLPGESRKPFSTLAKALVFILPSRFEGFPNALCEAMALGLPCIATDAAIGAQALIGDGENGLLVPSNDPDAMADAITRLLVDPEKAAALGTNARNILETLSFESVLGQWDGAMSRAISGGRAELQ